MMRKNEPLPTVSSADVARKLVLDYARGIKDQNEKAIEGMNELLQRVLQPDADMKTIANAACDLIGRRFGIAGTSVAFRDPNDLKFRYEAFAGLSESVVEGMKKLCYTKEQLLDPSVYKSYELSRYSRIFLGEDHPYAEGEEFSYSHPGLIGMRRRALSDSLEADYIDTFMFDTSGETIGYIEISGTRLMKLPDTVTIKSVELIALMLSAAIRLRAGRLG